MTFIKKYFKLFKITTSRLFAEKYTYHASALAFTTLLAIVPLLSVIVSIIAVFPIFTRFTDLARNYFLINFIPTSSNTIDFYLENFIQQATRLPLIGLIFLFFTVITLMITVEHTLNQVWGATKRRKRISAWLIYLTVLIISPIVIGLSVFATTYLFSISWISGTTDKLKLTAPMLAALPLLINTVIFSIVYIVVPNHKVMWRDGLFGGFVAAVLFELAKISFAFYIKHFPSYEVIYGAFATIPIFLLWIYISWVIVLFGALATHTQYQIRQKKA